MNTCFSARGLLLALCAMAFGYTASVQAISEGYRKQLEYSGCTQISDADGSCDIHKSKRENQRIHHQDAAPAGDMAHKLANAVAGKSLHQAGAVMAKSGWVKANADGTLWQKQSFVAELSVNQTTDRVLGVIVK